MAQARNGAGGGRARRACLTVLSLILLSRVGTGQGAVADLNEDGMPDILHVEQASLYLYASTPGGAFERTELIGRSSNGQEPHWFLVSDLDDDYRLDLLVDFQIGSTADVDTVRAFRNLGGTRFEELFAIDNLSFPLPSGTVAKSVACMVLADLNGDGRDDLVLGFVGGFLVLFKDDTGRYAVLDVLLDTYHGPGLLLSDLTVEDLDGDGDPDIAAVYAGPDTCNTNASESVLLVHHNDGEGRFSLGTPVAAGWAAGRVMCGRFDRSGHAGLLVLNGGDAKGGTGCIFPPGLRAGKPYVRFFPNDGSGGFADAVDTALGGDPRWWYWSFAADLDADGLLDVATQTSVPTTWDGDGIEIWLNQGDGSFTSTFIQIGQLFQLQAVADMDLDGCVDLVHFIPGDYSPTILYGRCDGSFSPDPAEPLLQRFAFAPEAVIDPRETFRVLEGDFDGAALPGLAAFGTSLRTFSRVGTGAYSLESETPLDGGTLYLTALANDIDGDGIDDLLWGMQAEGVYVLFGGHDGAVEVRRIDLVPLGPSWQSGPRPVVVEVDGSILFQGHVRDDTQVGTHAQFLLRHASGGNRRDLAPSDLEIWARGYYGWMGGAALMPGAFDRSLLCLWALPESYADQSPHAVPFDVLGRARLEDAQPLGIEVPAGTSLHIEDFTGDGIKDVVVVHGNSVYFAIADAVGVWRSARRFTGGHQRGFSIGGHVLDLDGDGDLDIAIAFWVAGTEDASHVTLWENVGAAFVEREGLAILARLNDVALVQGSRQGYGDLVCAADKGLLVFRNVTGLAVPFRRGDVNADTRTNVADAVALLMYLFDLGGPVSCADAGDANDDGVLNVADAVRLLAYIFAIDLGLPPPADRCGSDPTDDDLGCGEFNACARR